MIVWAKIMIKVNSTEIIDADKVQRENLKTQIHQGKLNLARQAPIIIV